MVKFSVNPQTGDMVTPTKMVGDVQWGTLRVVSEEITFTGAIARTQERSALINGPVATLEQLVAKKTLAGGIKRIKSFEPQWKGHSAAINPTTAELVKDNGREVYYSFQYSPSGEADEVLGEAVAPTSTATIKGVEVTEEVF